MRRYEAPPESGRKYVFRPGAYGIFLSGRHVLITGQQTEDGIDWQLPGGGIERDEQPAEALTREALEETGWRVHVERKLRIWKHYTYMPEYSIYAEKICHIYLGRALYALEEPKEPDHTAWLAPKELALHALSRPANREILATVLADPRRFSKRL